MRSITRSWLFSGYPLDRVAKGTTTCMDVIVEFREFGRRTAAWCRAGAFGFTNTLCRLSANLTALAPCSSTFAGPFSD
jgi:hypothetical protein